MTTDSLPGSIEACHELISELEEENLQLRQAAALFGQLAERLNLELRQERSLYADDSGASSTRTG
ncbi:MAG: hypothetical protein ABI603_02330 [Acidobacteriota bacterium]